MDGVMRKERSEIRASHRVVVKVGSSTITSDNGDFNESSARHLVSQLAKMHREGRRVVLVTSGAVACGRSKMGPDTNPGLSEKQALAAIGQPVLMSRYERLFSEHKMVIAQLLLTREDFTDARRRALCHNTLSALLARGIVPVVNENDTVAVDEIVVGDNDTLSAEVARLADADLLVLLTDIDGLYTDDPKKNSAAKVIDHIGPGGDGVMFTAGPSVSKVGTGGMATKVRAATLASNNGIAAVIANGSADRVLEQIIDGCPIGTLFSRRRAV